MEDVQYLPILDSLKSHLTLPGGAEGALGATPNAGRSARTRALYEEVLRPLNALDFNSLILKAHRLVKTFPAIAARYQRSHPHWLVDESQDTTTAQYTLLRSMAGDGFHNLFAVADDDQIIYAWSGASHAQIQVRGRPR